MLALFPVVFSCFPQGRITFIPKVLKIWAVEHCDGPVLVMPFFASVQIEGVTNDKVFVPE
jgi:hypothetical protein